MAVRLGTLPGVLAGQGPPPVDSLAPTAWLLGLEMSRAPAVFVGWETTQGGWTVGARTGGGSGRDGVRGRLTPALRLDRHLPWDLRVGASLGLEWTWSSGVDNADESEIQWELGGGWRPAPGVLVELGARRTDYRTRRWEGVARLALRPRASRVDEEPGAVVPVPGPPPGVPESAERGGRLAVGVAPPPAREGLALQAANPRGDPDPWRAGSTDNVDRLGLRGEGRLVVGTTSGWMRWRSDLHTDPSIAARLREVSGSLGFPVSVSFAGGGGWTAADGSAAAAASLRYDPKAFLWIPHLGEERTARVRALEARGAAGPIEGEVDLAALGPIEGRSVDPLEHGSVRLRHRDLADLGDGSLHAGLEHEWIGAEAAGRALLDGSRTRAFVERSGRWHGRLAAGSDVVLRVGVANRPRGAPEAWPVPPDTAAPGEGWRVAAAVELRSRPDLLHFESLMATGWAGGTAAPDEGDDPAAFEEGSVRAEASVGRGGASLRTTALWSEPLAAPSGLRRVRGGWVDLAWRGAPLGPALHARVRLRTAEWGPARGWWREEATLEGRATLLLLERPARAELRIGGRTRLRSERAGVVEPGGLEAGLALVLPLPLPASEAARAEARLDDLFDRGLAPRVGAPRRGRRLTVTIVVAP